MALIKFLLFLIPFHLLLLKANSECSESFQCGEYSLQFPFTDAGNLGCGLIAVEDCNLDDPNPVFNLGGRGRYNILARNSTTKFLVEDFQLQIQLDNRSCFSFEYLYPIQNPSISFRVTPNLTFFPCVNEPGNKPRLDEHFLNYNIMDCGVYLAYYKNSTAAAPDHFGEDDLPEGCQRVQMPKKSGQVDGDLFNLLSAEYTLEFNVTEECLSCFYGGGQCLIDNENQFYCKEGSNRTTVILLAICIPGSVILLLLAGYIIWQRKKKFGGVYLLPRNKSSDPSSRSFVEDGSFNFGIPIFSYTELVEATSNFDSSQELGDGGFGTVYYGKLQDGREVAIKRLYEHNYRRVEQFLNEIQILTSLRHPNLVSLYGCTSRRSRELLLVYEYIPNGTVADHLHGVRAKEALLTWPIRMSIARETANALAYLHKSDIIHRDVKTTNILLDNNFSVKVADFGLSRLFPMDVTHISTAPQGTPGYVDPEYHQCYQLTDKSDVYSFGVVLIELISSMPAVDISRHSHEINLANLAVNRIQRCAFDELIDPSTGYNSDPRVTMMTTSVAELAFRCLQLEKDLRPSMEEVLLILQDIQSGQGCNFEHVKKEANGNYDLHSSPETDAALLKSKNYQSSPTAVTDEWISSSTVASSVA